MDPDAIFLILLLVALLILTIRSIIGLTKKNMANPRMGNGA